MINSSNCRTHPRTAPNTAGPAGQGVAVPRSIGQEVYARVGGAGVLEIVQPRSQGQDTRECTAQSKCLDTTFVRHAGFFPAVVVSLMVFTRGLGNVKVTWWRSRVTLRPVWDHRVSTGPSGPYETIVSIAKRRMCPTPNCSSGLGRIVMCGLGRSQSMQCDRTTVCVRACVRACVYIHVCMFVNGGLWRASKWGGGLVRLKRCTNRALESPEVSFIKKVDVFVWFQW